MKLSTVQKRNLKFLEEKAHQWAEDECNLPLSEEIIDARNQIVYDEVCDIFGGRLPNGFFYNTDPRGYALKINNEKAKIPNGLRTDWGGYGLLAHPETTEVMIHNLDKASKIEKYARRLLKSRSPITINTALMRGLGYTDTRSFFEHLGNWGYNSNFGRFSEATDTRIQSYIRTFIKDQFIN